MSERKYFLSKSISRAFLNDNARASSLFFPYELTAITLPPEVTICPSFCVEHNADYIYLEGTVTAQNGELEIILTDGNDDVRFQQLIQSSDSKVIINEKFSICPGYWKLKYKSYNAQGTIDLHMKL